MTELEKMKELFDDLEIEYFLNDSSYSENVSIVIPSSDQSFLSLNFEFSHKGRYKTNFYSSMLRRVYE